MAVIPERIMKFSQGKTKLYTNFIDLFHHYRDVNGIENKRRHLEYMKTKKVGDNVQELSLDYKEKKFNKLLQDTIAEYANVKDFSSLPAEVWATNPNYKWATFAVVGSLIDVVLPETMIDSVGLYTQVLNGDLNDSFAFTLKSDDLFAVTRAGKGKRHTEVQKDFAGQQTLITYEHDITVQASLIRVLCGQESLAEFTMKAIRSIEREMNLDVYYALVNGLEALPTPPTADVNGFLRISGYTQKAAMHIADTVSAYNGKPAIFLGTREACSQILPDNANYRYDIDSEFARLGYAQTMFGTDVMIMPQVPDIDNKYKLLLDPKKIYVISPSSDKLIKLGITGATRPITDAPYDNANLTQSATFKKDWGVGFITNSIAGEIDLA